MKRRRSRMSDQKSATALGDSSQRHVQILKGRRPDERKDVKQISRYPSFPREPIHSDHKPSYSFTKPHRQHKSEQHELPTHWHSRERKQTGSRPRNLDIVPALSGRKSGVVSLNHLLNFTFAPRDTSPGPWYGRKQSVGRSGVVYNKEQFLQANCQFVVKEEGDYTVHAADADLLVDWSSVEQVRLLCHEMPSCPICLYPPVAAKITRCGHVYCWACLLHYIALSEKKWRKCPICYEAVHQEDLKSVIALSTQPVQVGDMITMQLMERQKGSVVAIPKSQQNDKDACQPLNIEGGLPSQFGKLLTISPTQTLEKIVLHEERELHQQLTEIERDKDDSPCFVEAALKLLEERKNFLTMKQSDVKQVASSVEDEHQSIDSINQPISSPWAGAQLQRLGEYEAAFSDSDDDNKAVLLVESMLKVDEVEDIEGQGGDESALVKAECEPVGLSEVTDGTQDVSPTEGLSTGHTYYFYQLSDGQHIYLHPLNTKCLTNDYGSMSQCPHTIKGRIIEIEQMTQSELIRKRYRFLSHLPLTCQFAVCELELVSPKVSKLSLDLFGDELLKRKQKRKKKARDEQRHEKHMESKQKDKPLLPSAAATLSQRRSLSEGDHEDINLNPSAAVFVPGADSHQPTSTNAHTDPEESSHPSFAQALCVGMDKLSPPSWPIRKQTSQTMPLPKESNNSNPSDTDEESSYVPSFQDSFFESFSSSDVSVSVSKADSTPKSDLGAQKPSKKGRMKQLLFSTGGQRRY